MTIREGLEKDAKEFIDTVIPTVFYNIEGNKQLLFKSKDFVGYKQTDTPIVHVIWKRVKCMSVDIPLHHSKIRKYKNMGLL